MNFKAVIFALSLFAASCKTHAKPYIPTDRSQEAIGLIMISANGPSNDECATTDQQKLHVLIMEEINAAYQKCLADRKEPAVICMHNSIAAYERIKKLHADISK